MPGRPTKYKPEYCDTARKLCEKFGATNEQLAEYFEVNVDTIYEWQKTHAKFSDALKAGKKHPDDLVEQALFKRATGYEHDAVKIFNNNGSIIEAEYTERYPPDTTAAIIWLKNRRPERWRAQPQPDNNDAKDIQINFNLNKGETRPSELKRLAEREALNKKKNGTDE